MQSRTRVTSKGQVTLPVALRRRLAIKAGDDLVFEETPDGAAMRVVHRRRLGAVSYTHLTLPTIYSV